MCFLFHIKVGRNISLILLSVKDWVLLEKYTEKVPHVNHASSLEVLSSAVYESWTTYGNNVFCLFCFVFSHVGLYFEIRKGTLWYLQRITGNSSCKSLVWFMGLIVRLQSDPQSQPVALQSGFITITINVSAFAHWKKNHAADFKKQTRTTAALTAVTLNRTLILKSCLVSATQRARFVFVAGLK